jgi:pyruvate-ferredoxin/flavodoxin oxidoreductase
VRIQAEGGIGWLRRLWRRSEEEESAPAPDRGEQVVMAVEPMLGAIETLICTGVVHRAGVAPSAARARRLEGAAGPAPRNAFGRPVQEEVAPGPGESVTLATGMALAGLRSTAFVAGDQLPGAHEALRAAAERLVPLVVHVANADSGHAGYCGVADCGCIQVLPSTGQEALDLSLVARWVAERALVPALVATDGSAVERLWLPDEETLRTYLGAPDESIPSPTEAQRILFGNDRSRLLRWFDPDRPVATGGMRSAAERARARLGSQLFFRDHVAELARQGMEELAQLTGRPLSFVRRHRLEDADAVLVAQGAGVQVAEAVADHLRRAGDWKVGVLGVTWLRPLPVGELKEALRGRPAVAVIEALDGTLSAEPPLFRELTAAVGATDGWVSATCSDPVPDPARLLGLCELLRRSDRSPVVRLEQVAVPATTGFPRRDALLQSLVNSYPALRDSTLPVLGDGEPLGGDSEGGCSVGLVGREAELPPDALGLLAQAVTAEDRPHVRGSATRPQPGVFEARVRAAAEDFADPGPRAPVSVLLVAAGNPRELGQPLASVRAGGSVWLASEDPPERIWSALPLSWQQVVREHQLRLLAVEPEFEAQIEVLQSCLEGEEAALLESGKLREVAWSSLPTAGPADRELPGVVRRIERARSAHDSLPRFWGEVVQPRQQGAVDDVPDPLSVSGVVPAGASGLEPEPSLSGVPVLDPEACTGCGRCWAACPDAAIGVTALGPEALFTGASHIAGTAGSEADALRRAHKHLAGRLAGAVAKSGAGSLREEDFREGWTWLAGQLKLSDEDRPAHDAAFEATLEVVSRLQTVVTEPFFGASEAAEKGTGELLVLAFDPRSCVGCNRCVAECPEEALEMQERSPERAAELEARWQTWEGLPDTSGATLARAAEHPEVGPLAALLLSRHCAQSQLGAGTGEAGSGERLAGRLVVAAVEHHAQQRMATLVQRLEEQREKLEAKARERLTEGLSTTDIATLAGALDGVRGGSGALSELGKRLSELGAPADFDRQAVLHAARQVSELETVRRRLAEGLDGLGRARFGVVVARGTAAEWAARFPDHPYYAPLTLAPTAEGIELARGIARGLVAQHLEVVRSLRRGAVEAEQPSDRPERMEEIAGLGWDDLETDDRVACPPLLLMGDGTALLEHGFGALTQLLSSDLPVKLVILDGRGGLDAAPEPALLAMVHRTAFVLSSSVAHPEHLAQGLAGALAWPGPALIHLHAPSPLRHGFAAEACLERARKAVESRAQILFRFDPAAEGLFGVRASLDGNPDMDEEWGGCTFVEWAAGESRFADQLQALEQGDTGGVPLAEWMALAADARKGKVPVIEIEDRRFAVGERLAGAAVERLTVWNTLREVSGLDSPFTEAIRDRLRQELEAQHQEEIAALKADHEAQLAEVASGTDQKAIARLSQRLITLSGYRAGAPRPQAQSPQLDDSPQLDEQSPVQETQEGTA